VTVGQGESPRDACARLQFPGVSQLIEFLKENPIPTGESDVPADADGFVHEPDDPVDVLGPADGWSGTSFGDRQRPHGDGPSTSLPSPCQQHGEVSVADYVRADAYRRVVRTLDEADVQLTRIADETDEATWRGHRLSPRVAEGRHRRCGGAAMTPNGLPADDSRCDGCDARGDVWWTITPAGKFRCYCEPCWAYWVDGR
jgi:hypothetical protein